ncbi:hypothetical protein D3C78_1536140 [compost metagenome]
MDQPTIMLLLSAAGIISAIILGWLGQNRAIRHGTRSEASSDATLKTDMEYIKRGVDDMRVEQKMQGQRFEALAERVTRVEESTKQAHHRITRLEDEH